MTIQLNRWNVPCFRIPLLSYNRLADIPPVFFQETLNQKEETSVLSKKYPEGPPSGRRANITGPLAPSSGVKGPVFQFRSVLTKPGHTQLMHTLEYFFARTLVYALTSALDTLYEAAAAVGQPLVSSKPSLKSFRKRFESSTNLSSVKPSTSRNSCLILSFEMSCAKEIYLFDLRLEIWRIFLGILLQ